jgi:hypothetical protein
LTLFLLCWSSFFLLFVLPDPFFRLLFLFLFLSSFSSLLLLFFFRFVLQRRRGRRGVRLQRGQGRRGLELKRRRLGWQRWRARGRRWWSGDSTARVRRRRAWCGLGSGKAAARQHGAALALPAVWRLILLLCCRTGGVN